MQSTLTKTSNRFYPNVFVNNQGPIVSTTDPCFPLDGYVSTKISVENNSLHLFFQLNEPNELNSEQFRWISASPYDSNVSSTNQQSQRQPRPSCVVGMMVVQRSSDSKYLLVKRCSTTTLPGKITFPAGYFEPNDADNVKTTAIREFKEEVGIDLSSFSESIKPLVAFRSAPNNYTFAFVIRDIDIDDNLISIEEKELETYCWLSASELESMNTGDGNLKGISHSGLTPNIHKFAQMKLFRSQL